MNTVSRRIGVFAYVGIALFLLLIVAGAMMSRHPWSLVCYNCRMCNSTCVLGIDPSGFLSASNVHDPGLYISATNIRLLLPDARAMDANMLVQYEGKSIPVRDVPLKTSTDSSRVVTTVKLRASDAARLCLRCNACAKICAFRAPILEAVHDLRDGSLKGETR